MICSFRAVSKSQPWVAVIYNGSWTYLPILHIPEYSIRNGLPRTLLFEILDSEGNQTNTGSGRTVLTYIPSCEPKQSLIPWMLPNRELKKLCDDYNVPPSWVTGKNSKLKNDQRSRSRKGENRKIPPLSGKQYRCLLNQFSLGCKK